VEHADGTEALLAQKLRTDPAFMALPLGDGALNVISVRFFHAELFNHLYDYFENIRLSQGAIHISKESGLFVAKKG